MNARGHYGSNGHSRTYVGASLVHTLELKQRYNDVPTAGAAILLRELARNGVQSSVGDNRWDVALKDGAWVRVVYYPSWKALEVTISDRELRRVEEMDATRRRYEAILDKITPLLRTHGATTVGAATYAGQQIPQQPRFAARTRAVKAVFDMYTRERAPYYVYGEVNGAVDKRLAATLDEANALFAALERAPGEVYAAVFDPTDPLWPGPAADVYHAPPQVPQDRPLVVGRGHYGPRVGITIYHSVGDRAEAVKAMAIDWNALYQALASQAGVLVRDPASESGYRQMTQRDWDANPPDPSKVAWWKSYAEPLFRQWHRFKVDQIGGDRTFADDYISFAERFQTNWDVYEDWKKKLDNLRADAVKRGFVVDTPKHYELPTTVWADVGDVVKEGAGRVASGIGDVWNLVKYGAWAVLGIGAVVAISSVASNLRSGKDPAEKYVEMIRSTRRPRAALPSRREQRALPPGEPEAT